MRLPASLHIVTGFVLLLVLLSVADGKKVEKKDELKKPETNVITQKPSIFSFIKRLLPEKTLEKLRAAVTAKPKVKNSKSKSKSKDKVSTTAMPSKVKNGRSLTTTKRTKKQLLTTPPAKKSTKVNGKAKTRLTIKVSSTSIPKTKTKQSLSKKPVTGKTTLKPKTPRYLSLRARQNDRLAGFNSHAAPPTTPTASEMEVLTVEQKSSRLRQELIRETEDNCLAKILCGSGGSKPKPKEKNTFVTDSAYLIKEFFNIFDFTFEEGAEKNNKGSEGEKKVSDDDDDADEEDELDADDEEDDIYRTSPIDDKPKKHKYTMNKTKKNPEINRNTKKPIITSYAQEQELIQTTASTTTSTTRRPKPVSVAPHEDEEVVTTVGDLVPKPPSTEDRVGEYSTTSAGLMTSTIISTSMTGEAALKPMDLAYAIPIKTAKDDREDDDDEEDDNPRYSDDRYADQEEDDSAYHRVTLEELVGDIKLNPNDFTMLRRGRSMKIALNNVTSDKYIQTKLKQMKQVKGDVKKLKIAQKVARSMREPRQCRRFSQVAEEVLQTCPLTTEVIRFFNANLRNGTSIEVKKTPPVNNSSGGGLVLLNNQADGTQQAYFVDKHANNANTKVTSDLKNPSVPSSYGQEELQYPVYETRPNPNPQNSNLNQHGVDITRRPTVPPNQQKQQIAEEDSEEANDDIDEDSDEDEDDLEDDDNAGRRDEEYDDEEQEDEPEGEEEQDDDDEDQDDDDDNDSDSRDREQNLKVSQQQHQQQQLQNQQSQNYEKIQGGETNQPNIKIAIRPKPLKRPVPAPPTLPPGIIRVYGIPTNSFDRDFSEIADQIGPKPVAIFGEEDIDRPAYNTKKKRRQLGYRVSKNAKHGKQDDEDVEIENVPFSSRVPKHPPLESDPYVNDGDDDDDEGNKVAYQSQKKNNSGSNGGKPLGGIKGGDDDDDDDDDDKKGSSEKKKNRHKDEEKGSGEHIPPPSVAIDDPPFVPSMMYSSSVIPQQLPQPQPSPHEYFHHSYPTQGYQVVHQHHHHQYSAQPRPRPGPGPGGFRPFIRPIKIYPGTGYLRPGRLYPLYG